MANPNASSPARCLGADPMHRQCPHEGTAWTPLNEFHEAWLCPEHQIRAWAGHLRALDFRNRDDGTTADYTALDLIAASCPRLDLERQRQISREVEEQTGQKTPDTPEAQQRHIHRVAWMTLKRTKHWQRQGLSCDEADKRAISEAVFYHEGRQTVWNEG